MCSRDVHIHVLYKFVQQPNPGLGPRPDSPCGQHIPCPWVQQAEESTPIERGPVAVVQGQQGKKLLLFVWVQEQTEHFGHLQQTDKLRDLKMTLLLLVTLVRGRHLQGGPIDRTYSRSMGRDASSCTAQQRTSPI